MLNRINKTLDKFEHINSWPGIVYDELFAKCVEIVFFQSKNLLNAGIG